MEKIGKLDIVETSDLEEYKTECFIKIKKDKEVYGLLLNNGFSDDDIKFYIATCNQFYNDYYEWKKIKTYDDVVRFGKCYSYKLVLEGNTINRVQEILPPYQEILDYNSKFLFKDYDNSFNDIKFSEVENKSMKAKIKDELEIGNWIYIYGAPRSGKTYCAIALLNASARKGNDNLAFIDCSSFIKRLSDEYFSYRQDFNDDMQKLKDASILVLDGFGNEYVNDIVRDNIILPLLNERASKKKMTIFTSSLPIDDVVVLYSGKTGGAIRAKQMKMLLHSAIKNEILSSESSLY